MFWLWPLAPPRFLPGPEQLVDLVAVDPWILDLGRLIAPALFSGFAAMPSLHCAFALWAALATVPLIRSPRAKLAVSAYPALMAVATIATGNHFLLDAVGAVAVLAVARVAVVGTERWRGLAVHSSDAIAGRAQVALLGVILAVWLPRGQWVTLGGDLLVLVAPEARRQQEQSLPAWRPNANTTGEEPAAAELWPALPD